MRRPSALTNPDNLDLPMTPMIDVVFQLIIFFLCTTRFTPLERILPTQMDLPGTQGAPGKIAPELADLTEVIIHLERQGAETRISLNGRPIKHERELAASLRALGQIRLDLPVVVDPDPDVVIEEVIKIYDLCRQIGFVRLQFAAVAEE